MVALSSTAPSSWAGVFSIRPTSSRAAGDRSLTGSRIRVRKRSSSRRRSTARSHVPARNHGAQRRRAERQQAPFRGPRHRGRKGCGCRGASRKPPDWFAFPAQIRKRDGVQPRCGCAIRQGPLADLARLPKPPSQAAVRGLHGRPGRNPLRHGLIDASRPIGNGGNERRLCLLIRGLELARIGSGEGEPRA